MRTQSVVIDNGKVRLESGRHVEYGALEKVSWKYAVTGWEGGC